MQSRAQRLPLDLCVSPLCHPCSQEFTFLFVSPGGVHTPLERLWQLKSLGVQLQEVGKVLSGGTPKPCHPPQHHTWTFPGSSTSPRATRQTSLGRVTSPLAQAGPGTVPQAACLQPRSPHSPGPEGLLLQTCFPAAPPMEGFATFPGKGGVCMAVPTPLPAGEQRSPFSAPVPPQQTVPRCRSEKVW